MNANGGMSLSNSFVVKFHNPPVPFPGKLPAGTDNVFEFLCDEAQLPNVQAATGTIKGRYTGEGQVNYPHTRIFSELQLGFQCDANMTPLKFLNAWYGMIFDEDPTSGGDDKVKQLAKMQAISPLQANRTNFLRYPKEYCRTISITKTEIGPPNMPQRPSVTYLLERAWPFAVDAVPLQFGSAQLTKVTAQFYYSRHTIIDNDITGVTDKPKSKS